MGPRLYYGQISC